MAVTDDVFVATDAPIEALLARLETTFGATVTHASDTGEPLLVADTAKLFVTRNDLDSDDDFPLGEFTYWVETRDLDRDLDRQAQTARRAFDTIKAAGWRALYLHDMQKLVDSYEPQPHARAS